MPTITAIEFFNEKYEDKIKAGDCSVLDSFGDEIECVIPNEWVVYYKSKEHEWLADEDGRLNTFIVNWKSKPTPAHVAESDKMCDWCGIQPAQHDNGECDDCWNLPGHEGEGSWPHSEIDALKAENARLRAALRPFADSVAGISEGLAKWPHYSIVELTYERKYGLKPITVANLQQAAAALADEEPHEP